MTSRPPASSASRPSWKQPVLGTVASKGEGIDELAAALEAALTQWLRTSGGLEERRKRRLAERTREVVDRAMPALGLAGDRRRREDLSSASTTWPRGGSAPTNWRPGS